MPPESSGKITFPASGTDHLNSTHFLRFTLSHHSMMIPAFVLLPGALLPFGEPLPEGFSLPFSVSPVPEFPPGNAGEKPPTLPHCSPAHFPLMHAYRPDGFPAQKRHSPVFPKHYRSLSPTRRCRSRLPGFRPRRSPASDQDGNCRRLGRLRQCLRFCLFRAMNACI